MADGVRLITGKKRNGEEIAVPHLRPVHLLRHRSALGHLPTREESNAAAVLFEHADIFNSICYGIVKLPECDPIAVSSHNGEMQYTVGNNGYDSFDGALLHAMAANHGMDVNDIWRFTKFVRAMMEVKDAHRSEHI